MRDSVLNRVLDKCRVAYISGTPIIYIKTDSDIFMEKLLLQEEKPIIVPIIGSRPLYEETDLEEKVLSNKRIANFKIGYSMASSYLKKDQESYFKVNDTRSANDQNEGNSSEPPFLWLVKMPQEQNELHQLMKDLEDYVKRHENKKLSEYEYLQTCLIILYSSKVTMSSYLMSYTEFIDIDYPEEDEIREIILKESDYDPNLAFNNAYLSALCTDFLGFTVEEIEFTMRKIVATADLAIPEAVEGIIQERKLQKMEGGILQLCKVDKNIGGMKQFRDWLEKQKDPLKNSNLYRKKIGTAPPKGVLLCGIPGCGKSEAAKFSAATLNFPLLKMDVGSMMDRYQGVSEEKMRNALSMAEAMSPCVLWIDELEKGFSSAGSENDASFQRMFGYLLGWMQENTKPCFIFATANDISGLPKEFFRSGRFDALYAVYLPTVSECVSIFQKCMKKAEANVANAKKDKSKSILFKPECYGNELLRQIINTQLIKNDRPRIIIGSDIQKIVTIALRKLSYEPVIEASKWRSALIECINDPTFAAYGDGEENIDSIAVGYCRMLRKGFIPASDTPLFENSDYRMKNLGIKDGAGNREEILRKNEKNLEDPYDACVYHFLRERINEVAYFVERNEQERLFTNRR